MGLQADATRCSKNLTEYLLYADRHRPGENCTPVSGVWAVADGGYLSLQEFCFLSWKAVLRESEVAQQRFTWAGLKPTKNVFFFSLFKTFSFVCVFLKVREVTTVVPGWTLTESPVTSESRRDKGGQFGSELSCCRERAAGSSGGRWHSVWPEPSAGVSGDFLRSACSAVADE